MFQQLLTDSGTAVFRVFELADPVVDGGIELGKRFFLFEDGLVGEAGDAWREEEGTDAVVEVAAAGAEGAVGVGQIFAAFIETS
jgi:hypothetical protein